MPPGDEKLFVSVRFKGGVRGSSHPKYPIQNILLFPTKIHEKFYKCLFFRKSLTLCEKTDIFFVEGVQDREGLVFVIP